MHTDAERNCAAKLPASGAASRKSFPYSITHGRGKELCSKSSIFLMQQTKISDKIGRKIDDDVLQ